MLTVTKRYQFIAGHWLPNVPPGHRCSRKHGHNYTIDITVSGEIRPEGWIIDFYDLDALMHPILDKLDHQMLNDIPGLENPTVENFAPWLMKTVRHGFRFGYHEVTIKRVRVYETQDCWCDVEDGDDET